MSAESARSWSDKALEPYSISIEDFAKLVKKYIDSKGKNHHVVFLVDEVGQYIGDNSKLMLNLQTVTEELGIACRGKAWMFLSSFEEMRTKLLTLNTLTTLMHMENMVMGIAFGTAVSVFRKGAVKGYKGTYNQIKLADIENAKPKSFPVAGNRFAQVSSDNFSKIPGMPVAYWVSEKFADVFKNEKLYKYSISPSQNVTGNNDRFVRKFWELSNVKVGGRDEWIFYAKGGGFRKWWGNLLDIVNWTPTARYIYQHGDGHHASQIINKDYWYRKGITWGLITSSIPSFRVMPEGATFDKGGSTIIVEREVYNYALGLLNSKVFLVVAKALNPTLNFQVKDICSLPLVISCLDVINSTVDKCIDISQVDWDSFETSWDFKTHPLLKPVPLISESFAQWSDECEKRFTQLKSNEEELNRIFIDIYGLQDELTPEVEDKDVTVRRADLTRDIKSLVTGFRIKLYPRRQLSAGDDHSADRRQNRERPLRNH